MNVSQIGVYNNARLYSNMNNKNYEKKIPQKCINFSSTSSWLVLQVAKEGYCILKENNKYKYVQELEQSIKSIFTENFINGIKAISKTPNNLYDGTTFSRLNFLAAFKKRIEYIRVLRWIGLRDLDKIKDDSRINLQIKKDFITSFLDNGHPISPLFLKQFKNLNDIFYKNFKEEIIDKVLYSANYINGKKITSQYVNTHYRDDEFEDEYCWTYDKLTLGVDPDDEKQIKRKKVAQAYQDLKLLSTLDKKTYKSFITKRANTIHQLQQLVKKEIDYVHVYQLPNPSSYWRAFYNDFYSNLNKITEV